MSALNKQVAGDHYREMKIQPVEFCQGNGLNYCEAAAIKYICRHKRKNGIEDIDKAIHFLELLKELEYPEPMTTENVQLDPRIADAAQKHLYDKAAQELKQNLHDTRS
jgi:hypothetical protein